MMIFNADLLKTQMIEMDDILADDNLMQTARRLTLGRPSGMNAALDHYTTLCATRSVDALGIFAYYMNEPIGWALFTYETDCYEFRPEEGQACAQVYVLPDYRRFGVGRKLIKMTAKLGNPGIVKVYHHSNYRFFDPLMKEHPHIHAV
jgi:GNAT superfamily N-acetyltransferase